MKLHLPLCEVCLDWDSSEEILEAVKIELVRGPDGTVSGLPLCADHLRAYERLMQGEARRPTLMPQEVH